MKKQDCKHVIRFQRIVTDRHFTTDHLIFACIKYRCIKEFTLTICLICPRY